MNNKYNDTKLEHAVFMALIKAIKEYDNDRKDPQKQIFGSTGVDLLRDQIGEVVRAAREELKNETGTALLKAITVAAQEGHSDDALSLSRAFKNIYGELE